MLFPLFCLFWYILTSLGFSTPLEKMLTHIYQMCTYCLTFQTLKYILIPEIPNKLSGAVKKRVISVLIATNKYPKLEVLEHAIV